MTDHGYLPDGRAWSLVQRGCIWEVVIGWDYADETYHRAYQGTLEACRSYIRWLRSA